MSNPTAASIAREKMVDSQVRPNQVNDRRITGAMRALPREDFAPPGALAYADLDINLGRGRYLLAPSLSARLAQLVMANNPAHVLVVGSGSGYIAAVLSLCGVQVVALEEDNRFDTGALARYAPNAEPVRGKLEKGWAAGGPYDTILIEGAVPSVPPIFGAQLVPGGRVITVLADSAEPAAIGRAVIAELSGNSFATARMFDCTARILPSFRPAPAFSF